MRRLRNVIATIFLAATVSTLVFSTEAKAENYGTGYVEGLYQNGDIVVNEEQSNISVGRKYLNTRTSMTAAQALYMGVMSGSESIDLTEYQVNISEIDQLYQSVINGNGDLFYVTGGYVYYYMGDYITSFIPEYNMEVSEIPAAKEVYSAEIDKILDTIDDDWSDLEKAAAINDFICTHFEYDTTYSIYDAYNMVVQKKGVCQAYTLLYAHLLDKVGIENDCAISEDMNHIWNVIKINGNWYHVDVTWNDPLDDMPGRARHANFMKSDTGIASEIAGGHYGWTSRKVCEDTSYDDAFWNNIDTPFARHDEEWYCLDKSNKQIYKCDIDNVSAGNPIITIDNTWYVLDSPGAFWIGAHSGFGICGGKIYYNTPDEVCSYDIETGVVDIIWTDTSDKNIYSIYVDGGTVYYILASSPYEEVIVSGEINICNHVWESEYTVDIESTCVTAGEKSIYCSICDIKKEGSTVPLELAEHAYTKTVVKEATCKETGLERYECDNCDYYYEEDIEKTTTHTWESGYTVDKKATTTKNGEKSIHCGDCDMVKPDSIVAIPYPKTIKLSGTKYTYAGKLIKPTVTVKDSAGNTVSKSNYTVSYGTTKIGKLTVTVKFKGNYTGTKTANYTVSLKAPALSSLANEGTGVVVKWAKVTGAKQYYVYRKTSGTAWKKIATVSKTTYTDKTAKNGTTYFYNVKAVNGKNVSAYSSSNGKKIVRLTAPAITSLKNSSAKAMKLVWKKNSKATGYQVQYSTNSKFTSKTSKTYKGASVVTKTYKSLKKAKTYYVKVRTYKKVGSTTYYSAWSTVKKVKITK